MPYSSNSAGPSANRITNSNANGNPPKYTLFVDVSASMPANPMKITVVHVPVQLHDSKATNNVVSAKSNIIANVNASSSRPINGTNAINNCYATINAVSSSAGKNATLVNSLKDAKENNTQLATTNTFLSIYSGYIERDPFVVKCTKQVFSNCNMQHICIFKELMWM